MSRRCWASLSIVLLAVPALEAQTPLGGEIAVNTFTTSDQRFGRVSHSTDGSFVVVWDSDVQDGSGRTVRGRRFDAAGAPLGGEFQVNTHTTGGQSLASVAHADDGSFVVSWSSIGQDGGGNSVEARIFDADATPAGGEFHVNQFTTGPQVFSNVSRQGDGGFVVTWMSYAQINGTWGAIGRRFAANGAPLAGDFQVSSFTTTLQGYPVVSHAGDGSFVVVWDSNTQDGDAQAVVAKQFSAAGIDLSGDLVVNTFTTGAQRLPTVSHAPASGEFVVTWQSEGPDGSGFGIAGRRYDEDASPLGAELQVNTFTLGEQRVPMVSHSADGSFVVAWQSNGPDGDSYGVRARRFAADGTAFGAEFAVNTFTTGRQDQPWVSHGKDGTFVVVWESQGQDGAGWSIQARRFCEDDDVDGRCNHVFGDGFESGGTAAWSATSP